MKIKDRIVNGVIIGTIILSIAFIMQKCARVHKLQQVDGSVKKYKQPKNSDNLFKFERNERKQLKVK